MKIKSRVIYNRIRKHRKIAGYKQKDVANLLGLLDATCISRWEHGTSMPNIIMLFKLSIIFRTLPTELYFELVQELREQVFKQENKWLQQRGTVKH